MSSGGLVKSGSGSGSSDEARKSVRRMLDAIRDDTTRLASKGLVAPAKANTVHYGPEEPSGKAITVGDLWHDTSTMTTWVANSDGTWTEVSTGSRLTTERIRKMGPTELKGINEAFVKLAEQMGEMIAPANAAMRAISKAAMLPHVGGWVDEAGWVCRRCGAESMDLGMLVEVPCVE